MKVVVWYFFVAVIMVGVVARRGMQALISFCKCVLWLLFVFIVSNYLISIDTYVGLVVFSIDSE